MPEETFPPGSAGGCDDLELRVEEAVSDVVGHVFELILALDLGFLRPRQVTVGAAAPLPGKSFRGRFRVEVHTAVERCRDLTAD